MHDIHVYTRAGCGWCSAVKGLLRKHGYTYHEVRADEDEEAKPARRRGRRGGRGRPRRGRGAGPLEATFDHGDEGYGLWLDPAVQDDPVYAEHWAGHRPVSVTIEENQIVIRRAGDDEDEDEDED